MVFEKIKSKYNELKEKQHVRVEENRRIRELAERNVKSLPSQEVESLAFDRGSESRGIARKELREREKTTRHNIHFLPKKDLTNLALEPSSPNFTRRIAYEELRDREVNKVHLQSALKREKQIARGSSRSPRTVRRREEGLFYTNTPSKRYAFFDVGKAGGARRAAGTIEDFFGSSAKAYGDIFGDPFGMPARHTKKKKGSRKSSNPLRNFNPMDVI